MGYKIRINNYLSQVRAEDRGTEKVAVGGPPQKKPLPEKKPETPPVKAPQEAAKPNDAPAKPGPAAERVSTPEPTAAVQQDRGSSSEEKSSGNDSFDLNLPSS
jgi:hypothetical protein